MPFDNIDLKNSPNFELTPSLDLVRLEELPVLSGWKPVTIDLGENPDPDDPFKELFLDGKNYEPLPEVAFVDPDSVDTEVFIENLYRDNQIRMPESVEQKVLAMNEFDVLDSLKKHF